MSTQTTSDPVAALDALPEAEAAEQLASCCGSSEWVRRMLARRPFGTRDALLRAADDVWWSISTKDWLEAFSHHPRIGERDAAAARPPRAADWSADEQRGTSGAGDDVRAALADSNREYERRFGHIYLVFASGRSAAELLENLRSRLGNDRRAELAIAAEEQRRITRARLQRLLAP